MMSITLQLQALYDRFDAMISGRAPMTTYEAAEFKRQLRAVMAKVGLMELGIANDTFDDALRAELPPSNIVPIDVSIDMGAERGDPELGANVVSLSKVRLDRIIAGLLTRPQTDGGAS